MAFADEDRISNLPDELLTHILSFLPTKYSVRTRVISTRWANLFSLVPILDFEYHSLTPDDDSITTSFIEFVNSVFISYNVPRMIKFRFDFYNYARLLKPCSIFSWVYSVIQRQVQVIDISANLPIPRTLPRELFSCKTLTDLRLWGEFNIVLPPFVSLPCLKTCVLGFSTLSNESARRLFRSCPLLERLEINECQLEEGVVLDISVPTLEHLEIHLLSEDYVDYQLVFNAPNLANFIYEGLAANKFFGLESLKSVVNVFIYCEPDSDSGIAELVRAISHVSKLYLSCGAIWALRRSGHSLPMFRNLTSLILCPALNYCPRFLTNLLDNSPRLEYLSFSYGYSEYLDDYPDEPDENIASLPEHVPVCLSQHLKEVDFIDFTGTDDNINLMKYSLKHAKNLKKMKIHHSEVSFNESFEISSETCQIVFYLKIASDLRI